MGEALFEIRGMTKRYGDRVIYQDFSFLVRRQERWCVLGANGAGNVMPPPRRQQARMSPMTRSR